MLDPVTLADLTDADDIDDLYTSLPEATQRASQETTQWAGDDPAAVGQNSEIEMDYLYENAFEFK